MDNVLSNKEHFKQDWIKQANMITGIDKEKLESIFNNHYKDGFIEIMNSVYFDTVKYNAVDFYYNSQNNLILNENGVCIHSYKNKPSITGWTLINGMGVRQIWKRAKNNSANIGDKIKENKHANLESKVKVKLNGFYGLGGFVKAYIYNIDIADTVTTSGRNIIAVVSIINELLGNGYRYYVIQAHLALINAVLECNYDEICEKYQLPDVDIDTVIKFMLGYHYDNYYAMSFLKSRLESMPYNALKVLYMRNNLTKVLELPSIKEHLKTLLEASKIDNLIVEVNGGEMINPAKHERTKELLASLCKDITELTYGFYYYAGDYLEGTYMPTMVDIVQNMHRNNISLADTDSNVTVLSNDRKHIMELFPDIFKDASPLLANNVVILILMNIYLGNIKLGLKNYAKAKGIDDSLIPYIDLECEMVMDQIHLASGKKAYTYNYSIKDFMRRDSFAVKGLGFIKSDQNPMISEQVAKIVKNDIMKSMSEFDYKSVLNKIRETADEVFDMVTSKKFLLDGKTVLKTKDNTLIWSDHRIKAVRLWNRLYPDNIIEVPGSFGVAKLNFDKENLMKFESEQPDTFNKLCDQTWELIVWKALRSIVTKTEKFKEGKESETDKKNMYKVSNSDKKELFKIYQSAKALTDANEFNLQEGVDLIRQIDKMETKDEIYNVFGIDVTFDPYIDIPESIDKIALPMDISEYPLILEWNKFAFVDRTIATEFEHKLGQVVTTMGIMCPLNKNGKIMTTSILTVF